MRLTKRQKDVLIGTLLGDGCLELNGSKVRLRTDHSVNQTKYAEWKYKIFSNIAAGKPRLVKVFDRRTKKIYQHCRFDTLSNDLFADYMHIFYRNGRKAIPHDMDKLLKSPLSLSVWYMDDGYKRSDCRGLHINTQAHCLEEQKLLQKCMKQNFGLGTNIHKQSGKYKLYIPSGQSQKFCKMIARHVIPSMNYKLL